MNLLAQVKLTYQNMLIKIVPFNVVALASDLCTFIDAIRDH